MLNDGVLTVSHFRGRNSIVTTDLRKASFVGRILKTVIFLKKNWLLGKGRVRDTYVASQLHHNTINTARYHFFRSRIIILILITCIHEQKLSNSRAHFLRAHWFHRETVKVKFSEIFHKILILFIVLKRAKFEKLSLPQFWPVLAKFEVFLQNLVN